MRDNERGGGSLTILKGNWKVHKEFAVNKDTKFLRTILHDNKVLWLCNAYLNKGRVSQIQKLFKSLMDIIPSDEWDRVIVIVDLKVNLKNNDE